MRHSLHWRAAAAPATLIIMAVVLVACGTSAAEVLTLPKQGSSATPQGELQAPTSTRRPLDEAAETTTGTPVPTLTHEPRAEASGGQTRPLAGALAPPLVLPDLNGKEIHLTNLRGRPVLLNFWTTW